MKTDPNAGPRLADSSIVKAPSEQTLITESLTPEATGEVPDTGDISIQLEKSKTDSDARPRWADLPITAAPSEQPFITNSLNPEPTDETPRAAEARVHLGRKNFLRQCLCQVDTVSRLPTEVASESRPASVAARKGVFNGASDKSVWRSCFETATVSQMTSYDENGGGTKQASNKGLKGRAGRPSCLPFIKWTSCFPTNSTAAGVPSELSTHAHAGEKRTKGVRGWGEKASRALNGGWTRVKGMSCMLRRGQ